MVTFDLKNDIAFRPVIGSDKDTVRRIYDTAYYDVVMEQFGNWDQSIQDCLFDEIWNHLGLSVIVSNSKICGFYALDNKEHELFIYEMVISSEYQGKGIGTYLISQFIKNSIENNKDLRLGVLIKNQRAKNLYSRLGFVCTSETKTHYKMLWKSLN